MAVLKKFNPNTQQWEILQGGVQGLQGPPVALSKGTVTTTPPGTNADFTVTGTPPNQKLNLTVPRGEKGETGNPSTYLLVGPGRPDVLATTGGTITGSEPVGAEYRSTNGANVGAWVWMKRPTGWEVTDGDTGWRVLTSWTNEGVVTGTALPAGLTVRAGVRGYIKIRRVGDIVSVSWASLVTAAWSMWQFPAGWQPTTFRNVVVADENFTLTGLNIDDWSINFPDVRTYDINGAQIDFFCDRDWPTTLPGTPA